MLWLNRFKKWAKSLIMFLINNKCLKDHNSKYFNIKIKQIKDSKKFSMFNKTLVKNGDDIKKQKLFFKIFIIQEKMKDLFMVS